MIANIARSVVKQTFHSCTQNIPVGKYDEYRNCFRDLSIELHNRLETNLPNAHFFVCSGRLNYAFMVTTINSKRKEYFISIGDILFELLEYDDLLTNNQLDEVNDDNNSKNSSHNSEIMNEANNLNNGEQQQQKEKVSPPPPVQVNVNNN